ncbi:hypothetical protein NEPAR06_0074 [Nematocida parisii]|uniref:Uncharacterized protein n=1 Tax=Nematocida parisii (strain ERTm3) TaxID=935791 RepID=I3EE44_NEMP3|nr:uncharacterized protein NEPG_00093 [Nematocida parisii ERTm1]EIJ87491.1 hypothetical protein NEQG_02372 [Nematocida parisii ERTm3]KAI5142764.1 hypothetical protein NEPAR07_0290 [Nematocida parisii]EIJ94571.1 hypothetical protein NEPG_00093 [Nematocida parisii ERTm1]KAI5152953.1 hypothetical protein NEPAR06_0074 [Nematocida parisii]KAI5157299.1 hypothetical protein NEPAR05_1164 [Nematocida parisii]|eukprot:XP_013057927.1 hypothetical protein NEPG_00093 [Nematocida parisii ERTm1]
MPTVLVIDASAVISSELSEMEYSKGYIPQAVADELKCQKSNELFSLHTCKIEIRNPSEKYIKIAQEKAAELGYSCLSDQDIQLAALSLELSAEYNSLFSSWMNTENIDSTTEVVTVTRDMTLKNLIATLGLQLHDTFLQSDKKYLQRCYTCARIYKTEEKIDFCKSCGYATISKVSYTEKNGKIELFLSKNYTHKERKIYTRRGKEIKSEDQKAYTDYRMHQRKDNRMDKKQIENSMDPNGWNCL